MSCSSSSRMSGRHLALRPENAPQTLGLLPPGSEVEGYLYDDVRAGDVEGVVTHFGKYDRVEGVFILKFVENDDALRRGHLAVYERAVEHLGHVEQREQVVREHDDLVAPRLVVLEEVLAGRQLHRVAGPQPPLLRAVAAQVLPIEGRRHGAPNLLANDLGQEPLLLQLQPVGLVQLRPDEPLQVLDEVVLPHQRRREPELAVGPHDFVDAPERWRRHELHLVEYQQPPVAPLYLVENVLRRLPVLAGVGHHGVAFIVRGEGNEPLARYVREVHELLHPLLHGDRRRREHEDGLPDRARGHDARQRLSRSTRQHYDARPRSPVAEHPPECALLVVSYFDVGADGAVEYGRLLVLPEVVLHHQRPPH
ncbi:PCI domain protein [Babesia caballi]|uniref:PCI domain protein n=1 Tax=Babesia caballi TaxID=5871 RepID=A0AAV4LTL3_BABCB|nr:PCI domain protein [Babesia caballi]